MNDRRLVSRLVLSLLVALGVVIGLTAVVPSYGGGGEAAGPEKKALIKAYDRAASERSSDASADAAESWPHTHTGPVALLTATGTVDDGHGHDHSDPTTKNAISRAGAAGVVDPTTAAQARRNVDAVAAQRAEPDPRLVRVPRPAERRTSPQDRYVMAGGCYALQGRSGWVARDGAAYAATAAGPADAEKFHFQATTLGQYLLWDSTESFLSTDDLPLGPGVAAKPTADESSIWTVTKPDGFVLAQGEDRLVSGDPVTTGTATGPTTRFALRLVEGCSTWDEIDTQVTGRTFAGASPFQEVRGTTDNHTHGMAFEFLGGAAHCGKPWSPYGVTVALEDCADHQVANGCAAALETALSGEPCHDPVGWPTFKDWPAPASLTHEGTYYKWMERSWRGGLRMFTNLLVENNQLCMLYPIKGPNYPQTQCDDTKSVELQARDMRELERYVDAQYGGPGKGWYRIVTSPWEARRVINQGKLAVIMGIETSIPFGCTVKANVPQCDKDSIDQALARAHRMGVRQMEIVNKFDNALSGITGDEGQIGAAVNAANFNETGSFWRMEHCEPAIPGAHDKEQYAQPDISPQQQDALFGAVAKLFGDTLQPAPVYPRPEHCNQAGLSELGKHLVKRLAQRNMVFDPDHMSVKARNASLDVLEDMNYPGVLSSHSWSTPDAYPRIYKMGGFITPYAGDSTGFVDKWRQHLKWADKRFYFGFGYGADMNGLGAQGDPRPDGRREPGDLPLHRLRRRDGEQAGQRRAGLRHQRRRRLPLRALPRLVRGPRARRRRAGTADPRRHAARGRGLPADVGAGRGRQQRRLPPAGGGQEGLPDPRPAVGLSVKQVLLRAGQPHQRLGTEFTYCARAADGDLTRVRLDFTRAGRLV